MSFLKTISVLLLAESLTVQSLEESPKKIRFIKTIESFQSNGGVDNRDFPSTFSFEPFRDDPEHPMNHKDFVIALVDQLALGSDYEDKGHKKGHKAGFKKHKSEKGNKGFTDHKGHKNSHYEDHGNHHKKGHHDKGGKVYKDHEALKKFHSDYYKGKKGKKGHHHAVKGHHNKGHKDKGFKNVYHKEEYGHRKKFYDDYDLKKHHKKYDSFDKHFKGHKGNLHKGKHHKGKKHHDKHNKEINYHKGDKHEKNYGIKKDFGHKKHHNDHHEHNHKKDHEKNYKHEKHPDSTGLYTSLQRNYPASEESEDDNFLKENHTPGDEDYDYQRNHFSIKEEIIYPVENENSHPNYESEEDAHDYDTIPQQQTSQTYNNIRPNTFHSHEIDDEADHYDDHHHHHHSSEEVSYEQDEEDESDISQRKKHNKNIHGDINQNVGPVDYQFDVRDAKPNPNSGDYELQKVDMLPNLYTKENIAINKNRDTMEHPKQIRNSHFTQRPNQEIDYLSTNNKLTPNLHSDLYNTKSAQSTTGSNTNEEKLYPRYHIYGRQNIAKYQPMALVKEQNYEPQYSQPKLISKPNLQTDYNVIRAGNNNFRHYPKKEIKVIEEPFLKSYINNYRQTWNKPTTKTLPNSYSYNHFTNLPHAHHLSANTHRNEKRYHPAEHTLRSHNRYSGHHYSQYKPVPQDLRPSFSFPSSQYRNSDTKSSKVKYKGPKFHTNRPWQIRSIKKERRKVIPKREYKYYGRPSIVITITP